MVGITTNTSIPVNMDESKRHYFIGYMITEQNIINELNRVLVVGGELIVSIPYWKSEELLLKIRPTYFDEIHHVRIFMEGDLEKMLRDKFLFVKKNRRNFLSHIEIIYLII